MHYKDQYEYQFKMYAFVHQCCCLSFIYKPKGARTAKRQRRWERKDKIMMIGFVDGVLVDSEVKSVHELY